MQHTYSAELLQTALGIIDGLDPFLGLAEARSELALERLQPRVELQHACGGSSISCGFFLACERGRQ